MFGDWTPSTLPERIRVEIDKPVLVQGLAYTVKEISLMMFKSGVPSASEKLRKRFVDKTVWAVKTEADAEPVWLWIAMHDRGFDIGYTEAGVDAAEGIRNTWRQYRFRHPLYSNYPPSDTPMFTFTSRESGESRKVAINVRAILNARLREGLRWDEMDAQAKRFGTDYNQRNMLAVRTSREWIQAVTDFAKEHELNVDKSICKAAYQRPQANSRS